MSTFKNFVEWFLNILHAPWMVTIGEYDKKVNDFFKNADLTSVELGSAYLYCFDHNSKTEVEFWARNLPYGIATDGRIMPAGLGGRGGWRWSDKRPSRYQMGRLHRMIIKQRNLNSNENKYFCDGTFVRCGNTFVITREVSKEEWEEEYSLYLLQKD